MDLDSRFAIVEGRDVHYKCARVGSPGLLLDAAMVERAYAMLTRPGNQQASIDFADTEQIDRSAEDPEWVASALLGLSIAEAAASRGSRR
ncbi:hypothetical protein [Nocardia asteroides]|uniref:hypothetical protein n=1 Tax=Nocardia asteroides TaxID=1824 RepID=UPI0036648E3D